MTTMQGARSLLAPLLRAHDAITTAGFELSKLCLVFIVFAFSYEVISRYFFAAPTWWANETVSYALCIGAFLAFPEVTRRYGHVAVTIVLDTLPAQAKFLMQATIQAIGFAACMAVAWMSLDQNIDQYLRGAMIIAAVQPIPKIYISVWITFGFFSSALYFLRNIQLGGSEPADSERDIRL